MSKGLQINPSLFFAILESLFDFKFLSRKKNETRVYFLLKIELNWDLKKRRSLFNKRFSTFQRKLRNFFLDEKEVDKGTNG